MGYSNNKWRKILTILMIINLCFILFAKISNVFAVSISPNIIIPDEINLPDWLDNYNWNIAFFQNGNYISYRLFITDLNNKVLLQDLNSTTYSIRLQGVKSYIYIDGSKTKANMITYLESLPEQTLSSHTASDGATYIGIEKSYISNNNFYTNSPLYNYSSSDNIIIDGNILKYPGIANSISDLESLNFDVISINAWDWSNKDFDILFYDRNNVDSSTTDGLYPKRVITLNKNTPYYQETLSADPDKNAIFWVPIEETGLNFYIGGNYEIRLAERVPIQRRRGLS